MDNGYQRNTVFLYPDLVGCAHNERMDILNLITEITSIVQMANRQLQELIDGGNFSFVNCMPKVYMRCVSDDPEAFEDRDNVRICITKYDNHDYTANYQVLAQKYKSGETNISHLVALNLSSRPQKTQFSPDQNEQFNAIINTGMDSLEKILVSIMFDISLYHYFLLSDSLHERKLFNSMKYKYISEHFTAKEQEEYYGTKLNPNCAIYLPISLPKVKKISRRTKSESRQSAVAELLQLFATFLAHTKSMQITSDQQGNIMEPSDKLPRDISEKVEHIVREYCHYAEFIIVFLHDSAKCCEPLVLECKNGSVPCWITRDCEGKTFQSIILVKQLGCAGMAFIAFFDLLGTRGFCDNPDIYYDNILRFNQAVIQTSSLLVNYGKVGVFSDSAYAGSSSLGCMLDFLVLLRNRLMAEGLFFNAVLKRRDLDFEAVTSKGSNMFGVAFKNSEIAGLYIAQTSFKGVGIFIDDSITDEEIRKHGYEVNNCVYVGRSGQGSSGEWIPVSYRDISLQKSFPEKRQQSTFLEISLRVFYASYVKTPKYGAYYISLFSNFIRSFGINLKWNLAEKKFDAPPLIFDVVYKMVTTEYKMLSNLPGIDYLVFAVLDMVYASPDLSEQDKISITKKYSKIECIRQKYLHNLNSVPRDVFSLTQGESHWARFIRYCQEDFANEFTDSGG